MIPPFDEQVLPLLELVRDLARADSVDLNPKARIDLLEGMIVQLAADLIANAHEVVHGKRPSFADAIFAGLEKAQEMDDRIEVAAQGHKSGLH